MAGPQPRAAIHGLISAHQTVAISRGFRFYRAMMISRKKLFVALGALVLLGASVVLSQPKGVEPGRAAALSRLERCSGRNAPGGDQYRHQGARDDSRHRHEFLRRRYWPGRSARRRETP